MKLTLRDFRLRFRRIYGVIDERFDDLLVTCANEILNSVDSLEHIERDRSDFEVLRELDGGYFIRPFTLQKSEMDLIDFEDISLITALFYKCAMHISTEGLSEYEKEYFRYINAYRLKISDENCHNIEQILEKNKYSFPYTYKEKNTHTCYEWNNDFLEKLDLFLADNSSNAGYQYRRFVWLFKEFQDGKNTRKDCDALDKIMSLRLIKGVING